MFSTDTGAIAVLKLNKSSFFRLHPASFTCGLSLRMSSQLPMKGSPDGLSGKLETGRLGLRAQNATKTDCFYILLLSIKYHRMRKKF